MAACALSLTLVIASQSRRWLLHRLTNDFATLPPAAQQQRLAEIAALGESGLPWLVGQLAAEDRSVARRAYDLLAESQNEWVLEEVTTRQMRHRVMIDSLQEIVETLPDDRTGWATRLVQQTILEHVEGDDPQSHQLHQSASELLSRLSLSGRATPSMADASGSTGQLPRRVTARSQLLTVGADSVGESWTDWPPRVQSVPVANRKADSAGQAELRAVGEPTIYRSSTRESAEPLVSMDPATVRLKAFEPELPSPESAIPQPTEPEPTTPVAVTAHSIDSPLQTYNMRSVMYWLTSPDQELRRQAELELMRRGLGTSELALAKQLSHGDVPSRLESIDRLVHDEAVDPRPWLLWLLDDERREVKLHVINILATMSDPSVQQTLRERMASESDPAIAARLRRALQLR